MEESRIPTQNELSELKDHIELFKESPIWRHIVIYMQEMYATAAEEALAADDITKVKWASGVAHAVRMISTFDDNIALFRRAKKGG